MNHPAFSGSEARETESIDAPGLAVRKPSCSERAARGLSLGLAFGLALELSRGLIASPAGAGEPQRASGGTHAQSLDEQVQEVKSDVLSITSELANLEEKLLFPSDSQLAVFVALEKGDAVEIDSARISLDGRVVAHHIYAFKELEALAKGGVQRLHTANLPTGGHQLEVAIAGRRGGDAPFDVVERFDFSKEVGPKRIGVRIARGATGQPTVQIEAW